METLQRLHNRGSVSTGYEINNSMKLEYSNTEYLKRTVSSAGNTKIWCASFWIKRSQLDPASPTSYWQMLSSMTSDGSGGYSGWPTRIGFFYSANQLWLDSRAGSGNKRLTSLAKLRDTAAWYHIVVMQDTTQATDTNRSKIYINGELLLPATLDYDQYPAQNDDTAMNVASSQICVGAQGDGTRPWSGYIADVHFLDGQSGKTASDFGEYDEDTGVWIPKAYTGAYGTNGFRLKFEDSSNMGLDSSGNGNNLTSNNVSSANQATDTPTNNFTTFNVVRRYNMGRMSFKQGATVATTDGSGNTWTSVFNTMAVNKGKWYWEGELYTNEGYQLFGHTPQASTELNIHIDWYLGKNADGSAGAGYYGSGDDVYYAGGYANSSASTTGDIISVAMDCDNNKVHFAVNGSWTNSSNPVNNTNGFAMTDEYQYFAMSTFIDSYDFKANFGGFTTISISSAESDANGYGTFEYAPPTGYYALCTKNLAEYG